MKRTNNSKTIENLSPIQISTSNYGKHFINFDLQGSSNYAFPLILNTKSLKSRDQFEKHLTLNNIEFRRGNAGGGNQLRQPYIKEFIKIKNFSKFKNVERIHFFGYYIGNYPELKKGKIAKIVSILNNIKLDHD